MRAIVAAALLVGLGACGGGGDDDGGGVDGLVESPLPTGGWSNLDDTLFACFDNTNRADFGDTRAEVAVNPCCVWQGEGPGTIYFPAGNTGTWEMLNEDTLSVTADPPCEGECDAVTYRRNPTLTCFP